MNSPGGQQIMAQKKPDITIEKMSQERAGDLYEAILESQQELLAEEFISESDVSLEVIEGWPKEADKLWKNDEQYHFQIIETTSNQLVGWGFLNNVKRRYQMANLGYFVRTSRIGEGIATEAAKRIARYGFEKLGFQRIEIVVPTHNLPSLRIAEKVGAVQEGLLRNRLHLQGSPRHAYMHSLIPADYGFSKSAE
jgi:ribosomal-protein-serine acetyltransferase